MMVANRMKNLVALDREAAFGRTDFGVVFTGIWLQFDDTAFPAERWSDFSVAFLNACLDAVLRILVGLSDQGKARFMEGPYMVRFERLDSERLLIRAIDNKREVMTLERKADYVAGELLRAAEILLSWCHDEGWHGPEEGELQYLASQFRDELRSKLR